MLSFVPETARAKFPAVVVCGSDARARTEVIERLLAKGGANWAVISNETVGPEFPVASIERIAGQMVPHAVGCLCCVARSGLVSSLRQLFARRTQGEVEFDHVLIETLADSDPAPVMQTLLNNALVTDYFRLDSVVAVIARDGLQTLATSQFGFKQLAVADRIVLDPASLAAPEARTQLQGLNPGAELVSSDQPCLADALTGAGLETRLLNGDLGSWLASSHYASRDNLANGLHGFSIEVSHPFEWEALHGWLNAGTEIQRGRHVPDQGGGQDQGRGRTRHSQWCPACLPASAAGAEH